MSTPNPFLTPEKKSRDNPFLQDDSLVDLFDPLPELRRDKVARGDKDPEGDLSAYQQAIYGLESGVINVANTWDASRIHKLQKQKNQILSEGRLEIGKRRVGGLHGYEVPVYATYAPEQIPGVIENIDGKLKQHAKELSNNLMIQSGVPRSAVMQEISEAETFSDAWNSFLKDPLGVMATVTAESFPIMAPALIVAPFNPLLGAVVMGLSSGGIEYGGELLEALAKTGITQEDLIAASQNEALMAEAEQNGIDRGLIIGTIDALSAGLARKMLISSKLVGSRVGREALNIPAQIAAQMVAGGGGEAAAQLEKSGEITAPGHVFLETVGEGALAPVEVLAFAQKRKAADRDDAEGPPPSDDLDTAFDTGVAQEPEVAPAAPTEPENPFMEPAKPAKPLRTAKQVETGGKTIAERPQGAEKVSFAGDRQVNTRYVLVERDDLVASHTKEGKRNLNYPQKLQPRDRSRAASQAWAAEKAGRFQPELMTEGPSLAEGAPTITPDGVVVSGNGRKILMDAIYGRNSEKVDEYKAYLRDNAENFGLAEDDIDSLNEPVLVRVLMDEISDQDLIALAQAANVTETAKLSPVEQAKVDAGNLTENDLALLEPDQAGNLLAKTNDKFVKAFLSKMTAAEIGNFVSKDGQPLKPLVDRMQAAIFAKAYADDRVLELMAEVANPTLKNIITAMVVAAPAFARARAHGDLGNLNIVDPLLEGMGLLMAARQADQTISQFLDQGALFEAAPPMAVVLGKFLEANNKSAVRMGEALTRIATAIEQEMLARQTEDIFGDEPAGLAPIIQQVDDYMTEKYGAAATIGSADLFDQPAAEPEKKTEEAAKPDEKAKIEDKYPVDPLEEPAANVTGQIGQFLVDGIIGKAILDQLKIIVPAVRQNPKLFAEKDNSELTRLLYAAIVTTVESGTVASPAFALQDEITALVTIIQAHRAVYIKAMEQNETVEAPKEGSKGQPIVAVEFEYGVVISTPGAAFEGQLRKDSFGEFVALRPLPNDIDASGRHALWGMKSDNPYVQKYITRNEYKLALGKGGSQIVNMAIRQPKGKFLSRVTPAQAEDIASKLGGITPQQFYQYVQTGSIEHARSISKPSAARKLWRKQNRMMLEDDEVGKPLGEPLELAPEKVVDESEKAKKKPRKPSQANVRVAKRAAKESGEQQLFGEDEVKIAEATAVAKAQGKELGAEKKKPVAEKLDAILSSAVNRFVMEEAGQGILDEMDETGATPQKVSALFWDKVYPELNEKTQKKFQQMLTGLGWEPGMAARKDADGKVQRLKDWSDVARFFGEDLPLTTEYLEGTERGYVALMRWAIGEHERAKHEGIKDLHVEQIEQAEKETDTEPSEAQIEAENYKTGKVSMHGLKISIENPKGSTRSGTDKDGNEWSIKMEHSYGRILGTVGKDKDHIDIFLGEDADDINMPVFVIDQVLGGAKQFDEHKVMMGFPDEDAARAGYLANYEDGWQGLGEITQMTMGQFKHWLDTADHNRKAAMTFKPQASMIAKPKETRTITLAAHKKTAARIRAGDITAKELKQLFESLLASEEGIKAELKKRTVKQLAPYGTRGGKKAEIVNQVFDNMARRYTPGLDALTWSPFSESYIDALRRQVEQVTDESIQKAAEEATEAQDEFQQAMTDPKTLEDFVRFVGYRGKKALSLEQTRVFEKLQAERTKEIKKRALEARQKISKVELGDIKMSVQKTKHTKKGHDLWVVTMDARVERETFSELRSKAQRLGGYYSGYNKDGAIPGFQFTTEEMATSFMDLQEGEVSVADVDAGKADLSQAKAVERLNDMADKLEGKAKESLGADRQTNTAKRARQASSAEDAAQGDIALAKTMRNLAKGIASGATKYLSKIRHKSHVELLARQARLAHYDAARKNDIGYEKAAELPLTVEDIDHAKMPGAMIRVPIEQVMSLARMLSAVKGAMRVAKKLEKMAESALRGGKGEWVFFTDIDFVAQVVKKIDQTGEKYEGWQLRDPLKEYRQLSVMDITTLPEFKEALREFVEFQSAKAKPDPIKQMERDLVGTRIAGYFPTPPSLLKQMIYLADVEHTDSVLEPSAGKGSIVEAVIEGTPALKAENVDVIEIVPTLRNILEKKGMNIVGTNFLELDTDKQYDKILMNPPFENGQDIDHVMKAYDHLAPGGRIVAIMSEGPFFRNDAKAKEFREWLDDKGVSQKNAEGAFKESDRATGVATRMVIIDKPADAFDFAPAGQRLDKPISQQNLQRHIDRITSRWKLAHPQLKITPRVFVIEKANGLPESTLKKIVEIQRKTGKRPRVRGAFKRSTMSIFLVAENIKSLADAERILFHELLGHYGLLITFGNQAASFLNHAYMVFGKKYLDDIITRYSLDVKTLKGRQDAAEEGLSKLAEVVNEDSTEQRLKNLWAKLLAKIDGWLRQMGFRSKMSKAELRVTMMKVSRTVRFGLDVVTSQTAEQIALSTEPSDPLADAFDLKGAIKDDKKTTRTFWQMLRKGQLIDRLFRLPFKFIGQVDEHGRWSTTPRQKAAAVKAVELSKRIAKTSFRWLEPMLGAARTNIIEQYGLDELATKLTRQFLYGFVDKYGQTEEYKQRARQAKAQVRELLMERDDVLKTLASKGFGIEESKLLQKALTGELIDDADITGVAAPIINAIDEMGGELVLLGMLDKAAYERNRRIYLHRSYQKYEIEGGLAGWVSKFLKSRRQRIVGDQFKRRGIHKQVSLKDLRRSIPASWWGKQEKGVDTNLYNREFIILDKMSYTTNATIDMLPEGESKRPRMLERVFWPADEAVPAKFNGWENRGTFEVTDVRKGVATLSRDYTKEERDRMGEILDARYNIAKTYSMVAHDLASGRFFRDIAKNKDWAIPNLPKDGTWTSAVPGKRKVYSDYDWVHVPETKVPGTNVKRYGDLAGMYVRSAIWIDLNEQEMMANPGMWTKVLRQWKLNKTARSPVVHMNNIISNLLFMDMADIRMRDLIVGLQSYVSKDSHFLDAVKHGAFSSGFIQQEIDSEVLRPLLKEIIQANLDMDGGVETRLTLLGKLMTGIYNLDKTMTRTYQMEDEIFRMATYMRRLTYGDTPEEAAALANYQFLDYNISAPYINAMKNTVFPFIAYSYRAIPVIASSLAQRPWKLAKYATIAYVANALAYLITDDDEEDEQRRMMREEVSGYTWVGSPRLMRMPWNDEYDNPVFLDVRRWIPAGDVFDLNQGQSGFMPAWLQLSGPLSIGFEVFLNKQSFTGDEITNQLIDTPTEQTGAIANFLWKSSLPSAPWIPGSWYWEKIKRAATEGAVDSLGHDYTVPMALASSMGIKLRSVDPNMQKTQQGRQFQKVERALVFEMKILEYQYANKHINGDEYLRRKKILEDKLTLLGEKAKFVFTGEKGNRD